MAGMQPSGSSVPDLRREDDMKDQREEQQRRENETRPVEDDNQRKIKRRERECEGYTYIEMVGWMDRREKCRREDDRISD